MSACCWTVSNSDRVIKRFNGKVRRESADFIALQQKRVWVFIFVDEEGRCGAKASKNVRKKIDKKTKTYA